MASGPFMNTRIADQKREDFRRYLEEAGVLEAMTRALAKLNDESQRPTDPMQYICNTLKVSQPGQPTIDGLRNQLADAQAELKRLRSENEFLVTELSKTKPMSRSSPSSSDCASPKHSPPKKQPLMSSTKGGRK
uniref:Uncharacterized protein n=1 Tax=Plectus sambesii TaxID=2011161 RepID=A0A914VVI4_9BILA